MGPTTFKKLLKIFGTVENILGASSAGLTKVDGIGARTADKIAASLDKFNAEKELAFADKLGVFLITLDDPRYPVALKAIYDPPPVLYVKGILERSDNLAMAIVGSRRCSTYGSEQASRFGHILGSSGFTIVSGMARGIDTAAHRGALSANARTIAVQGCGLANTFPPENQKLKELIAENGAVVSELPMGYEPLSENFPARNRIIAGLSMGVIVIEATARSGALISARAAMENSREVMAIPGKIDSPLSAGAHKLIKEGARLVDCIEDVMESAGIIGQGLQNHVSSVATEVKGNVERSLFDVDQLNLSEYESKIYKSFDGDSLHVEDIISTTQLTAGAVNSALISLRLKGLIKQLPGNQFKKLASATK